MQFKNIIGLGVAGNFANHLEQAGELADFKDVKTEEEKAPKGIFPYFIPNSHTFLGTYPVSSDELELPKYTSNAQVEPEVAILFDVSYNEKKEVIALSAKKFTAFNDCTIRKEGAKKISEKKNWCEKSKGIAKEWIEIDKFRTGGIMDDYNICSFVVRNGQQYPYGVDVPLTSYSYFYEKLENWLIDKLNNQSDFGPLENIHAHSKTANYPEQAVISIGATAYAEFGENNYLQPKDKIFIIVYDRNKSNPSLKEDTNKVILSQLVE